MKYKVTTITTQHYKSTYMVEAENKTEAILEIVTHGDDAVELINQEAYGREEFPESADDFIVETF